MLLHRTTTGTKPWRRPAAAVSAAALGVGLLTECGSGTADGKAGGAPAAVDGAFPVTVERASGTTEIPGPDYEKIASPRPDLIVAVHSGIGRAAYDKLSRIAPTVGRTEAEKEPFSAPWRGPAVGAAMSRGTPRSLPYAIDELVGSVDR